MKSKKQEGGLLCTLLAPMAASLIVPMASSLIGNGLGKAISEIEKRQEDPFLPLLLFLLFLSSIGKGDMRAGKGYNNMDYTDKKF